MARANNHNDVVQYLLQHQSKWKVDSLALLQASYYTAYLFYLQEIILCSKLTLYFIICVLTYYVAMKMQHFITLLLQNSLNYIISYIEDPYIVMKEPDANG